MANKSKKSLDINGLEYVASKVMTLVNSGGTADYLVEQGTSGNWTYRKWASGVAECWGKFSKTIDITTTWGNQYWYYCQGQYIGYDDFPENLFTAVPECFLSNDVDSSGAAGVLFPSAKASITKATAFQLARPTSKSGYVCEYSIYAKGLWKEFTTSIMQSPQLDLYYPIGSIYQTSNANFDPNVTFGGTWELITNKFLIGAGDEYELGETGGSTEHTHKYGVMYHTYFYTVQMEGGQGGVLTMENGSETTLGTETTVTTTDTVATNNANAASGKNVTAYAKSSIGYTGKESTIPPYKAVYMWERTA